MAKRLASLVLTLLSLAACGEHGPFRGGPQSVVARGVTDGHKWELVYWEQLEPGVPVEGRPFCFGIREPLKPATAGGVCRGRPSHEDRLGIDGVSGPTWKGSRLMTFLGHTRAGTARVIMRPEKMPSIEAAHGAIGGVSGNLFVAFVPENAGPLVIVAYDAAGHTLDTVRR